MLQPAGKKVYDLHIEALRGFAAVFVFIHHLIIYSNLLNGAGYDFRKRVIPYSPSGHLMVLVFFMMSGYVIGLNYTNQNKPFNTFEYLKKRLVRLYPIYLFAVGLTIVLFKEQLGSVIGTLFFTQNLFTDCLQNNNPLWSLNHEIVYYLLAIVLLGFKVSYKIIMAVFLFLLLLSIGRLRFPEIIEGYLTGFIFWLSGYIISAMPKTAGDKYNGGKLLATLFLLLGCDFLNITSVAFSYLPVKHGASTHSLDGMVLFGDFSMYIYCLYALMVFTHPAHKWLKWLALFVYASSLGHLFYLIWKGSFFNTHIFYVPTFFILLSLLFYFIKGINVKFTFLIYLGSISYALYVVHAPILFAIGKIPFLSGTTLSYFIRVVLAIVVVIGLSHLLEKKLQPAIKNLFFANKTTI